VVFDFNKRQALEISDGFLYEAVAASCAMPGIFEPIKFKDDFLLDGGILNPLPAKVLLADGINKIISVNVTPSVEEIYKSYNSNNKFHILDFIFGSIETMQREFVLQACQISDVVIHPDLSGIGWTEFAKIKDFIKRGEIACQQHLEQIKKLVE
jgi:NTE family protein